MTQDRVFVGIDVSKARLDVAVTTGEVWSVSNDRTGWTELIGRLGPLRPEAVGLEPSGGYERDLIQRLIGAGLNVRRVEAGRVRRFAEVLGLKAKTDRIDAVLIARFVQTLPGRTVEPDARAQALAELVDARRALCDEQVRVRNQADQVRDPMLRRMAQRRLSHESYAGVIVSLDEQEQEAVALLEQVRNDTLAVSADVPVAVTTTQVDASTAVKMKALQVRRVLIKPFKVRDVIATIGLLKDR